MTTDEIISLQLTMMLTMQKLQYIVPHSPYRGSVYTQGAFNIC